MKSFYPQGIGKKLTRSNFDFDTLEDLKKTLGNNYLLNIYGAAGVGKGTLSRGLASSLDLPQIDSGKFWRALTYIYRTQGIEHNLENTKKIFKQIHGTRIQNYIEPVFDGQVLGLDKLRSVEVNTHVASYAIVEENYHVFMETLGKIITEDLKNESIVLDGRGANPKHVIAAANKGKKIIRILLDGDYETRAEWYILERIQKNKESDPTFKPTDDYRNKLKREFQTTVITRDAKDIEGWKRIGLGLITEDTGIIMSTDMSIEEVRLTALNFIQDTVEKSK